MRNTNEGVSPLEEGESADSEAVSHSWSPLNRGIDRLVVGRQFSLFRPDFSRPSIGVRWLQPPDRALVGIEPELNDENRLGGPVPLEPSPEMRYSPRRIDPMAIDDCLIGMNYLG